MSDQPNESAQIIWSRTRWGAVHLAGSDISHLVRSADLHVDADSVPKLTLELDVLDLTSDTAQVDVQVGSATAAILQGAGWLPPGEADRLRIVETASIGAHALLADAEAEVERLREWSNEMAGHVPDDQEVADPEGTQEGIISAWVEHLGAEVDRLSAELADARSQAASNHAVAARVVERRTAQRDQARQKLGAMGNDLAHARYETERLRGLVAQYARWVEACEGTDFLDRGPEEGDNVLTVQDLAELQKIRREVGLT